MTFTRAIIEELYIKKIKPFLVEDSNGCLLNTKASKAMPYASIAVSGRKNTKGNIISYLYHNNIISTEGLYVLHSCDVKSCGNPEHLHLGTHQKNMQEMNERGLVSRKGINNPKASLTEKEVIDIYNSKENRNLLARRYGIKVNVISKIKTKTTWWHLTDAVDELMSDYFGEVFIKLGRVVI